MLQKAQRKGGGMSEQLALPIVKELDNGYTGLDTGGIGQHPYANFTVGELKAALDRFPNDRRVFMTHFIDGLSSEIQESVVWVGEKEFMTYGGIPDDETEPERGVFLQCFPPSRVRESREFMRVRKAQEGKK